MNSTEITLDQQIAQAEQDRAVTEQGLRLANEALSDWERRIQDRRARIEKLTGQIVALKLKKAEEDKRIKPEDIVPGARFTTANFGGTCNRLVITDGERFNALGFQADWYSVKCMQPWETANELAARLTRQGFKKAAE